MLRAPEESTMSMEKYGAVPNGTTIKTSSVACDEYTPKAATSVPRDVATCGNCAQQENITGQRTFLCPHRDGAAHSSPSKDPWSSPKR
jgi:hypothetical protein